MEEFGNLSAGPGSLLGKYLLDSGDISREQLESALQRHRESKNARGLLGQILVDLGFTSEEAVTRALARQAGVEYVNLEHYPTDDLAQSLIEPETARRYQAFPLAFENGRLVVAMAHPTDIIAIDDMRIMTGYDIKPVISIDSDFQAALQSFLNRTRSVDSADQSDEEGQYVSTDEAAERPAVQLANVIFNQAVAAGASDIHIEAQEKNMRIRLRIDGVLHQVMTPPRRLHPSLISRIKVLANMDIAERRIPQDGRVTMRVEDKTIDVRVASLPSAYGEKMTLRLLDRYASLITLTQLGLPASQLDKLEKLLHLPYGFILVTGPTGSGKTTSLYASLAELNSVEKHIITVEDPIEYRMDGINQVQVNPKAGLTFASGLRSILRNDPDIIMIGEIRDHETARIAVESSLTGHLVLSTLHTNDASGAISRLGDMGIEPYLTASSLVGVLAQRLVRLLCKNCREKYVLSREEILASVPDFPLNEGEDKVTLYRPGGCIQCSKTGYRGRKGVYELLVNSDQIQRLTLQRQSAAVIKEAAISEGMVTLRIDGLMKVKDGLTSLEEIMRVIV